MGFELARIVPPTGAPIEVRFNPSQYGLDASFMLAEQPVVGQKGVVQYTSGSARSLSMDLFFDTYELGRDVRRDTDSIYKLVEVEVGEHRPPIVVFSWGKLSFRCMLERVSGRFTLFLADGVPVRATLGVRFREYLDPKEQPKFSKTQSADHTKTYVVQRGDSLSSIAGAEYRDPTMWRPIALRNAIDNPRRLEVGRRLVIPPIPDRIGSA